MNAQQIEAIGKSRERLLEHAMTIGLPHYMHEGLVEYIVAGRPVGNFLTAVLENDLREACARADNNNAPLLHLYVQYLRSYAPMGCWGSEAHVGEWREHRGLEGL